MFTGIIEAMGEVITMEIHESNIDFVFRSALSHELKVDQSIAHNGVCLTVVEQSEDWHRVTAILETLERSNIGLLQVGDQVNLERAMRSNGRLDGHIVQGHVDATGQCLAIEDRGGSWDYRFSAPADKMKLLVDKGSVCINGVSLTLVNPDENSFGVSIIPYTYEHTNFGQLKVGDKINLEFDIIGKYVARMMEAYAGKKS